MDQTDPPPASVHLFVRRPWRAVRTLEEHGSMSRVYLAARYGGREEILARAIELAGDGHAVTSRWLLGDQLWDAATLAAATALEERGETPPEAARFAIEDWADLRAAEVVILFTEPPGSI